MLVIPAIDLLEGRAVRLAEGDRSRVTIYSDVPWELAARFVEAGARRLHIVDLDGAFAGRPAQLELLQRVIAAARTSSPTVQIQVGGGIRDAEAVQTLLDAGVDLVVLGTLAVREPELVTDLCRRHPQTIVVAIDARDGNVSIEGWQETSSISALDLGRRAVGWGAAALLYTDVSRDGLQGGPAVASTAALQAEIDLISVLPHPVDVIASGGVGSLDHLDALDRAGVRAVICGRALYERSFTFEEALTRC